MSSSEEDRKHLPTASGDAGNTQSDGFVNRVERSEIIERPNYVGGEHPLFEQHISLYGYTPAHIRLMTSGLFGGDAGAGSISEVELCFEDSEIDGHASFPPGRAKLRISAKGDAELIQMAEAMILAGLNLLKLANHATAENKGDAAYLEGSGLQGVMPDGVASGIKFET